MKKLVGFGICDCCGKEVSVYEHGDRYRIEIVFEGKHQVMLFKPQSKDTALQIMGAEIAGSIHTERKPPIPLAPRLYLTI